MKLWQWFKTHRKQKYYLKQDVRVLRGSLMVWASDKSSWEPLVSGLPYSFGKLSCTLVRMDGTVDLMYALFFRENPLDYFAMVAVHPVMIFYTASRGFWREDFISLDSLHERIGDSNYEFLMTRAAINWAHTRIV